MKAKGRRQTLYLAIAQPVDRFDVTEYDAVAYGTSLSDGVSRNQINSSDSDSGDDSEYEAGRRDADVSFQGHYDFADDPGQKVAWDAINAADGKVHWLLTSNISNDIEDAGEGIVGSFNRDYPDEGMATVQIDIKQTGSRQHQLVP